MKGLSETQVQRAIVKDARARGLWISHIPNGAVLQGDSEKRARQMQILKADGLVPGTPDLVICDRNGNVGFIECKREKGGKLSDAQAEVRDWLLEHNHNWALASKPDALAGILMEWGWEPPG